LKKFLIIQTAFIGDVILASPMIEKIHRFYPDASIDLLVRKGNEVLFKDHPFLHHVYIWNKKDNKFKHLLQLIRQLRKYKYDTVINLQRFASTGLLTCFLRGNEKVGFKKNPFSFCYDRKIAHEMNKGLHEVDRNLALIEHVTDRTRMNPKLYPNAEDEKAVAQWKNSPYICIAPTSVWFTKQTPKDKWIELINKLPSSGRVYLLGSHSDVDTCERIKERASHPSVFNLCGKLHLLESASLMRDARMNYVNDSAPLHLASAMNAPTKAVFCSTVPDFGFGPLSDHAQIIEIDKPLYCRPCGLHGYKACPEGHFKCGHLIDVDKMLLNYD
jgi:ADP-heptose:LPS heptosyltransferase